VLKRDVLVRGLHAELDALGSWVEARPRFCGALLVFLVLYGLLINAWVSEDAYITLRSTEQLLAGNGPRWNPHERVQAYTHPLWFWLLCAVRLVVPSPFFAALALGLACSLLAIALLYFELKRRRGPPIAAIAVLTFLSSKSVMDYTTSGLENSLSYLLTVAALSLSWRWFEGAGSMDSGVFLAAALAIFLLASNRLDSLSLTLPLLLAMALTHVQRRGVVRTMALLIVGAAPLVASSVFSLVYYGFPLPNTAYAKVLDGIGLWTKLGRGLSYATVSTLFDPLLAVIVVGGVGAAFAMSSRYWRAVGAGIVLNVMATIAVGGDFMMGRFFTLAFLASLFALAHGIQQLGASRLLFGLILFAFFPFHPLHPFADRYAAIPVLGIADERAYYARSSSLEVCASAIVTGDNCPSHYVFRWGQDFARSKRRVSVMRNIGFYGYAAGVDKIVVDEIALSDAFLARLPLRAGVERRVGHGLREIPEGYVETLESGRNLIRDPALSAYYAKLTVLTQATPLLSRQRLETILDFNLGRYDRLLEAASPAGGGGRATVHTTDVERSTR
jgi:arabinofuranosyltransferase